ncbi:MAG: ADP-ribosylglycohydrolase family protein [Desulfococcaceae bacterium]
MSDRRDRFRGLILGTAVGDALGLPAEGISRRRSRKLFTGRWRHRFLFGRGMVSDDTDHTVFAAQSLLAHPNSPEDFARRMAGCLKWWFLSLPAGIGWATLRAILLLWIGFPPDRSGIFSAGNGPAMRSAPIGAFFSEDMAARENFVRASTRLTHTDPKALSGAKAVADTAAWIIMKNPVQRPDLKEFSDMLARAGDGEDSGWDGLSGLIVQAAVRDLSVIEFAEMLGLSRGISGYVYHTVPVALYACYRHFGDFEATLGSVLDCGGDTDTVGAIAGALAGAVAGESGIPPDWIKGIWEWPRSVSVLREMADQLEKKSRNLSEGSPVKYFRAGILPRNLFFLCIVLVHGFRRLLPPY